MKKNFEDRIFDISCPNKVISSVKSSGVDSVMISTGRNIDELGEVGYLLRKLDLPYSAIALEDGKRLLVKPNGMPAQHWINEVFNKDRNPMRFCDVGWQEKNSQASKLIATFLEKELGYIHRKNDGEKLIYSKPIEASDVGVKSFTDGAYWKVTISPVGVTFNLNLENNSNSDVIDVEKYNDFVSKKVEEFLLDNGHDISKMTSKLKPTFVNSCKQNDINKGAVADYYRQYYAPSASEIRAGNDHNDISMLSCAKPHVANIFVGDNKAVKDILSKQSNVIYVNTGDLSSGIDETTSVIEVIA